ncbi:hypothetical protein PC129_g10800 [Phytophthora cactorum]|uniref:Reverse transcriptase domain-containing protein n=1 Tax=Phytophthora cactorum TaxID=29920 RepID=A0A8T1I1X0_9STRA|nr:hypothetical protein PC129_g10800 [Phytophthora cactorum]
MLVADDAASVVVVHADAEDPALDSRTRPKGAEPKTAHEARYAAQSLPALEASGNPVTPLVREFIDIFPAKFLPLCLQTVVFGKRSTSCPGRSTSHRQAGHVRESLSPHSSPTFCVEKATGGWRIVHAFNKLNESTIPAQTPIPRKDMVLDSMSGSTTYSAINLMDGFYQILMLEDDVPLTAVSTPSGMM